MDPELIPFIRTIRQADFTEVAAERRRRRQSGATAETVDDAIAAALQIIDHAVPGFDGAPDIAVRVYRPRDATEKLLACVMWIHGGGFVIGSVDDDHARVANLALSTGAVVISIDYRLAPEHPFPAALDDCYATLAWIAANAEALAVDPDRVAAAGASAGGGLAAALALRTRDEHGPSLCFQLLDQPALDDRIITWSSQNFTDTPVMNSANYAACWGHYLARSAPFDSLEPLSLYAAPARATDLSGLPPAYVATAEFDPLRDEGIDYARRLMKSGVSVELHQWRGVFHGSQRFRTATVSQRQLAEMSDALRRAFL